MAVEVTYHGKVRPRDASGALIDALPAQIGNTVTVTAGVSAALTEGIYEITAMSDGLVRWGDGTLANATGGDTWKTGESKVVWIVEGGKVAAST